MTNNVRTAKIEVPQRHTLLAVLESELLAKLGSLFIRKSLAIAQRLLGASLKILLGGCTISQSFEIARDDTITPREPRHQNDGAIDGANDEMRRPHDASKMTGVLHTSDQGRRNNRDGVRETKITVRLPHAAEIEQSVLDLALVAADGSIPIATVDVVAIVFSGQRLANFADARANLGANFSEQLPLAIASAISDSSDFGALGFSRGTEHVCHLFTLSVVGLNLGTDAVHVVLVDVVIEAVVVSGSAVLVSECRNDDANEDHKVGNENLVDDLETQIRAKAAAKEAQMAKDAANLIVKN